MTGPTSVGPWDGASVRWLAGRDLGGKFGAVVEVTVPAGEGYPVHTIGDDERVVYLVDGEGMHRGSGGPGEVGSDDVLIFGPDSWHGFENTGSRPAKLWIAWAPGVDFPAASYSVAGEGASSAEGDLVRRKLRASVADPSTTPANQGFDDMGIRWVGEETRAITLGWAQVEGGGGHRMHRHTHADEVIYIDQGTGRHTTPGSVTPLVAPAYDFVPSGEWHEVAVPEGRVEGAFFYLGANSLEASGYELPE